MVYYTHYNVSRKSFTNYRYNTPIPFYLPKAIFEVFLIRSPTGRINKSDVLLFLIFKIILKHEKIKKTNVNNLYRPL